MGKKSYESIKVYIYQEGKIEITGFNIHRPPAQFNRTLNVLRDKRKLLVEIFPRGDVYLSFRDMFFKLTKEQIVQICGLHKNLRLKDTQNADKS